MFNAGGGTGASHATPSATVNATPGAVQAHVSNAGAAILPGANNGVGWSPAGGVTGGIPAVPAMNRSSLHTAIGENKATPEQVNQGYQSGWVDAYGRPQQAQRWNNAPHFSNPPTNETGLSDWDDKVYKAMNPQYGAPLNPAYTPTQPKKLTELSSSMNWLFYPDYMKHSTGTKVNTGIGMR